MRTSESMRRSAAVEYLKGEDCSFVDSVEFTVDRLEVMVWIVKERDRKIKDDRRVGCARNCGVCDCEEN